MSTVITKVIEDLDGELASLRVLHRDAAADLKSAEQQVAEQVAEIARLTEAREVLAKLGNGAAPVARNGTAPAKPQPARKRGRGRGNQRQLVLDALKDGPATAGELATRLGLARNSVATLLVKSRGEGAVVKVERGYALP